MQKEIRYILNSDEMIWEDKICFRRCLKNFAVSYYQFMAHARNKEGYTECCTRNEEKH
jgi:hypothetical protein